MMSANPIVHPDWPVVPPWAYQCCGKGASVNVSTARTMIGLHRGKRLRRRIPARDGLCNGLLLLCHGIAQTANNRRHSTCEPAESAKPAQSALFATRLRQTFQQRATGLIVWDQPKLFKSPSSIFAKACCKIVGSTFTKAKASCRPKLSGAPIRVCSRTEDRVNIVKR
jgi:hypothetical protein